MERVWDSALRHPSPTGSRALPAEAAGEALPRGRPGWGKGERERGRAGRGARPEARAPPALATYRGSSSSQGRGRSSSERSVHPTVSLKGASANQRASRASGGISPAHRVPLNCPRGLETRVASLSKSFLGSAVRKEPGSLI